MTVARLRTLKLKHRLLDLTQRPLGYLFLVGRVASSTGPGRNSQYRNTPSVTADEIKLRLNGLAEEFAHWLFPVGRKNGNEWLVGSLAGESGKSLSIRVSWFKGRCVVRLRHGPRQAATYWSFTFKLVR